MRRHLTPILAALLSAGAVAAIAAADRHDGHRAHEHHRAAGHGARPYAIGLWGDLPYSDTQKTSGVPNLVADMNAQGLTFTAHDGDIKSGSSRVHR